MDWAVDLESVVEISPRDLGDVADDLLTRLEMTPRVTGATAFAVLPDRIGARFDLDASGPESALRSAMAIFKDAMSHASNRSFRVTRVEVVEEPVPATP